MMDGVFVGWAAYQQARATEGQLAGQRAAAVAENARSQVEKMQADLDRLMLCTQALWEILKEEHGYSEEQLVRRITEIDMQDGRLDGKVAAQGPVSCPDCGRINKRNRSACLYCGTPFQIEPFSR
jgi:hypothetical protein